MNNDIPYRVSNADVNSIKPSKPYEQPKPVKSRFWGGKHQPIPGKRSTEYESSLATNKLLPQKINLDHYRLPSSLERILTYSKAINHLV